MMQSVKTPLVGWNKIYLSLRTKSVVLRSSAEPKFRVMAHGVCDLLWLRILSRSRNRDMI